MAYGDGLLHVCNVKNHWLILGVLHNNITSIFPVNILQDITLLSSATNLKDRSE